MRPHYSQSSRENATPSSGTSLLASFKEVSPLPGVQGHVTCQNFTLRPSWGGGGRGEGYVSPSSEVQKRSFRVLKNRRCLCRYFTIIFVIFLIAVADSNQLHVVCRQFSRFVLLFQGHVAYRNSLLTSVL